MLFSAATSPGSSQPNEDWAAVSPTIGVILDGVTVFDQSQTGCHHGTPRYVSKLGTHLFATASDPAVTLAGTAPARAIKDVAALHADTCDLEKIGAPSAAVGAVLGSVKTPLTTSSWRRTSQSSWRPSRDEAPPSDDRVVDTVSDLEGQENIGAQKRLERRARYRNQSGGDWVAAADPSIAEHTITGHIRHAGSRNAGSDDRWRGATGHPVCPNRLARPPGAGSWNPSVASADRACAQPGSERPGWEALATLQEK